MEDEEEMTLEDKRVFFNVFFAEEFDSIFSADIICCENCVHDFIKFWPRVNNDINFQSYSVPINSLYSMMRFSNFITEEEFIKFSSELTCPRCDNKLNCIIYPYNMPFDVPDGFEQRIEEIAKISDETPFLLLSHPFALEVYQEIASISLSTELATPLNSFYRARLFSDEKILGNNDFLPPPKEKVVEGRYNHSGRQVLYLSEEPETCFHELRSPNKGVMVASIQINEPIKILDLEQKSQESSIISLIRWSSLMSSPGEGEGWYKPYYVFTRFVADCAKAAGFDAIRYPSVRFDEGVNLVLLSYEKHKRNVQIDELFFFNESNTKNEILLKNY